MDLFTRISLIIFFSFVVFRSASSQVELVRGNIDPNPDPPRYSARSESYIFKGKVYFQAYSASGVELWATDGTSDGTFQIADINPGTANSSPRSFISFNDNLFFVATVGMNSWLYKTDGVSSPEQVAQCLSDTRLRVVDDKLYFTAGDLFATDGTSAGTYLVKRLAGGTIFNSPIPHYFADLQSHDGSLYFVHANFSQERGAIFRSDGTANGTIRLTSNDHDVRSFLFYGDNIFFTYWNSEGNIIAAMLHIASRAVLDLGPFEELIKIFSGKIYGLPTPYPDDGRLFVSTGTAISTFSIKSFHQARIESFTVGQSQFFFVLNGSELWRSKGTPLSTHMIKNFDGRIESLYIHNDILYFRGFDLEHGHELWRSDGTSDGTYRLLDLEPGPHSSEPHSFIEYNGSLLFSGITHEHGRSLWKLNIPAANPQMSIQSFPNPADDFLTLRADDLAGKRLLVLNIQGQPVMDLTWPQNEKEFVLDIHRLPRGMYFMTLPGSKTMRFMKK
ncbi:MAG: T9SS type A sorting domain-containing protein [Bacteroidota bacterium]